MRVNHSHTYNATKSELGLVDKHVDVEIQTKTMKAIRTKEGPEIPTILYTNRQLCPRWFTPKIKL